MGVGGGGGGQGAARLHGHVEPALGGQREAGGEHAAQLLRVGVGHQRAVRAARRDHVPHGLVGVDVGVVAAAALAAAAALTARAVAVLCLRRREQQLSLRRRRLLLLLMQRRRLVLLVLRHSLHLRVHLLLPLHLLGLLLAHRLYSWGGGRAGAQQSRSRAGAAAGTRTVAEGGGRRAEGGGWRAEGGGRRVEGRGWRGVE